MVGTFIGYIGGTSNPFNASDITDFGKFVSMLSVGCAIRFEGVPTALKVMDIKTRWLLFMTE